MSGLPTILINEPEREDTKSRLEQGASPQDDSNIESLDQA